MVEPVQQGLQFLCHDSGREPVVLRPGDIAIVRGPEAYTVGDAPGATPHALIGPGGTCHTLRGEPL
ncbi:cupin domain-containing protein, partial [Streptomyces niveus]